MSDFATAAACLAAVSAVIWSVILLLPSRPWSTRESLDTTGTSDAEDLSDVTAVIPARNEAEVIGRCLRALADQGRGLKIAVVDDQSTDGTPRAAREATNSRLEVVAGEPLPAGWSGKLWALEQGRGHVDTPLTLLLDADIELRPGILAAARAKLRLEDLDLVSLLAAPHMDGLWEKLLMPAFVYFFKLLYPFRLSASQRSKVAAAAGGFVLVKTRLLHEIGGFAAIRDELIDDCALARRLKYTGGGKIWLGLTHSARSLRCDRKFTDIYNMVARTAFTQLRYSNVRLGLCTLLMLTAFCVPVLALIHARITVLAIALYSLAVMLLTYLPTLKFYDRSPAWGLAMPLIGALYLAITWGSALTYWRGRRACWKGRVYRGEPA